MGAGAEGGDRKGQLLNRKDICSQDFLGTGEGVWAQEAELEV